MGKIVIPRTGASPLSFRGKRVERFKVPGPYGLVLTTYREKKPCKGWVLHCHDTASGTPHNAAFRLDSRYRLDGMVAMILALSDPERVRNALAAVMPAASEAVQ
jgi:hypothetical protein